MTTPQTPGSSPLGDPGQDDGRVLTEGESGGALPSTAAQWAAVHAALRARDMPAVVAMLHPLAVSDPDGVELFMAVVAGLAS